MRCLYCGKELALLKRLTGGGEFCSEAHKQAYQEEYNRLGLSRLLQARSQKAETRPNQPPPDQPASPVAVAEPAVEKVVVEKEPRLQPVAAVTMAPPPQAAAPEPPPPAPAGFSLELPTIAPPGPPSTYLEPWLLDDAAFPAPTRNLASPATQRPLFALRVAQLLPLAIGTAAKDSRLPAPTTDLGPKEFGLPRINLSASLSIARKHEFEHCGSIVVEIAPRPSESSAYASLNGAIEFAYPAAGQAFELLAPVPAGIAFPAEDCDVTIPESWTNGVISDMPVDLAVPAAAPVDTMVPPAEEAGPRAALKALSRLHQDMRERKEAVPPEAPPRAPSDAAPQAEAPQPAAKTLEPAPREASELLPISVKSFAPQKPGTMVNSTPLRTDESPLVPRLKGLPLRPKVAAAPRGMDEQLKTASAGNPPAEVKTKPAAPAPQTPPKAQPAPPAKAAKLAGAPPASKAVQPPQAAKPEKPVETAKTKPAVPPKPATPAKPQTAPPQATQQAKPAEPGKATEPAKPAEVAKPDKAPELAKTQTAEPKPALPQPAKVEKPAPQAPIPGPRETPKSVPSPEAVGPNFGAVVNTSMFGSLKVKLGIAAIVAVISIGAYFLFAGKSAKAPASAQISTDGVGPSIMLAQGGWVEGWAGDPTGLHAERQITIYRPSLKLSDYRIEFEGQIETKSIGWVFRAADPENYYAMKLVLASPELPLQVALYKYLVLKGRQVQVGRVPIDVPVKNDTVFKIRVDVRGPKFSTSVQGQPVDVWTDDQLKSGGVGFLNERGERGKIKTVSLFYLTGGAK